MEWVTKWMVSAPQVSTAGSMAAGASASIEASVEG